MLSEVIYLLHFCTLIVQFCEREKFMQVFSLSVCFVLWFVCMCVFLPESSFIFLFQEACLFQTLHLFSFSEKTV